MVAEYKACSFKKNARKGIVSKSEKAYRSVYQSLYYVSANCSDRRIYIDTFIGIDISKSQLCAQLRVCNQVGGNPIYPRSSQPDNSESWDVVGNSN